MLGIDLAKQSFELHGHNKSERVVLKKKISGNKLPALVANLPPCVIAMEACSSGADLMLIPRSALRMNLVFRTFYSCRIMVHWSEAKPRQDSSPR